MIFDDSLNSKQPRKQDRAGDRSVNCNKLKLDVRRGAADIIGGIEYSRYVHLGAIPGRADVARSSLPDWPANCDPIGWGHAAHVDPPRPRWEDRGAETLLTRVHWPCWFRPHCRCGWSRPGHAVAFSVPFQPRSTGCFCFSRRGMSCTNSWASITSCGFTTLFVRLHVDTSRMNKPESKFQLCSRPQLSNAFVYSGESV